MDMYKLKFTRLQNEIFRLLCIKVGTLMNKRTISGFLNVSPTAVSKALVGLEKEELIKIKKDPKMNLSLIELNRDNQETMQLKRVENLKMLYESELIDILEENFPGTIIILFGSYSYGEDTKRSDIDIAIIGAKQKEIELEKFERLLEKEININFYQDFKCIHKNLRSNIFNGIILIGRIGL